MKKFGIAMVMSMMLASFTGLLAQYQREGYLGLPGDNLNLFAVMKLFQESETLEGFERSLNDENNNINNLDLDGDNRVDYISVFDNVDGNVHNIILQVAITRREFQDVAVFTVIRDARGNVEIQLIGDEALYGRNYIIEPNMADARETPNPGYTGNVTVVRTTAYEIAAWPLIRFMFLPTYVVWHSPWYYGYYPPYWSTWHPYYWHYYYGYHSHWNDYYYGHYRPCDYYRYSNYHTHYYSSRRSYSPHVSSRIEAGSYKKTYSRPDQQRNGEALYNRRYLGQNTRTSGSTVSTQTRTSSSGTARTSTGTSSTRRISTYGTTRQSTGSSATRQPTTTTTQRQSTGTTTTRKLSGAGPTARKQETASASRPSSGTGNSRQVTTTTTTRKTTTATSNRTSRSSGGQSVKDEGTSKKAASQGTTTRKSSTDKNGSATGPSRRAGN